MVKPVPEKEQLILSCSHLVEITRHSKPPPKATQGIPCPRVRETLVTIPKGTQTSGQGQGTQALTHPSKVQSWSGSEKWCNIQKTLLFLLEQTVSMANVIKGPQNTRKLLLQCSSGDYDTPGEKNPSENNHFPCWEKSAAISWQWGRSKSSPSHPS